MPVHQPLFSLIIPVYNEAERITTLPTIIEYLRSLPVSSELIIVNDGSTDDTLDYIRKLGHGNLLKVVSYPTNQGKGYAIQKGMQHARGHWRGFMDIDLSVPLKTIETVLRHTTEAPIIIGTRRLSESTITQAQSPLRQKMGSIFTNMAQVFLDLPVSDFTCGFKFFRRDAAEQIFPRMRVRRWSFDPELLFIAHHQGWQIHELPVSWQNDARTKVKFPQDAIRSLQDLLLIRFHYWVGWYR